MRRHTDRGTASGAKVKTAVEADRADDLLKLVCRDRVTSGGRSPGAKCLPPSAERRQGELIRLLFRESCGVGCRSESSPTTSASSLCGNSQSNGNRRGATTPTPPSENHAPNSTTPRSPPARIYGFRDHDSSARRWTAGRHLSPDLVRGLRAQR